MTRRGFLGITFVIGTALAAPRQADAGTILDLGAAACTGAVCAPLLFSGGTLTLTAEGGTFTTKTRNGETGLGVSGRTRGEIDVNEFVRGAFSSAVSLDAFTILFLYNGGEFGDPNEVARISINGGAMVGTLTANAENTAAWSIGGASVTNCGETNVRGTGCFRIANPFGNTSITHIEFTAVSAGSNLPNDSDFSLGSIEVAGGIRVAAAPEPPLFALFTAAALGLAAAGRNRRREDLPA